MQFHDVTDEEIERLVAFRSDGPHILSLYLDLGPSLAPTPAEYYSNITSLTDRGRHLALNPTGRRDVERAKEYLLSVDTHGVRTLACFACEELGLWKTMRVGRPVGSAARFGTVPAIEPLIDQPERISLGVLVAERHRAILWTGDQYHIAPTWECSWSDERDIAGRSHARSNGHGDRGEQTSPYNTHSVTDMSEALKHHRRKYERLVLVADGGLLHELEAQIHPYVTERVVGNIPHRDNPTADDLLKEVRPIVSRWTHKEDIRHVDDTRTRAAQGRATLQLADTLNALNIAGVSELLYAAGCTHPGYVCDDCGWLSETDGTCSTHGQFRHTDNVVEHALRQAISTGASVRAVTVPIDDCVIASTRFVR